MKVLNILMNTILLANQDIKTWKYLDYKEIKRREFLVVRLIDNE